MPRVLIADDEPALLRVMTQYLARLGYEVAAFPTAQEAWETFQTAPATFSLVIVDATLDQMPGEELLDRVRALNPRIACLLSSGYPVDLETLKPELRARTGFLQKPFTPSMLAEEVARLLEQP